MIGGTPKGISSVVCGLVIWPPENDAYINTALGDVFRRLAAETSFRRRKGGAP
jgi:hypothetical protein